jgi:hypothetical protein
VEAMTTDASKSLYDEKAATKAVKKRYAAPTLIVHGTVQELTKSGLGPVTDTGLVGSR